MPLRPPSILLALLLLAGGGGFILPAAHAGPFTGGPTLSDPLVHRASKFTFPAKFGSFQRALPQQYDAAGQDFSIAYDSLLPPVSVTVFVYPAAGRSLEDEFARRQNEITAVHPDARLLAHGPATLSPDRERALSASYRYRAVYGDVDQAVFSALLIARHGDRFVAYRVVYPETAKALASPAALKFEQAFPWP